MLRCCIKWGVSGFVLGVMIVVAAGLATMPDHYLEMTLALGAILSIGSAMLATAGLAMNSHDRHAQPVDDAYENGRDFGYQLGWKDCARRHVRPVGVLDDRRRSG